MELTTAFGLLAKSRASATRVCPKVILMDRSKGKAEAKEETPGLSSGANSILIRVEAGMFLTFLY
jgi:hypothetical protein